MTPSREEQLTDLVKELLYLVEEVTMPRCELHRRAAEARVKAEAMMIVGPSKRKE